MTNLCALAVLCVGVYGTRYQPTNEALWVTDTIASATIAHTQKSLCWVLELRHVRFFVQGSLGKLKISTEKTSLAFLSDHLFVFKLCKDKNNQALGPKVDARN